MKKKHDEDRRIQRTRQWLSDALFGLIVERGYDAVTVQDIAERANVGRATFYLHYKDKEELLADSLKRVVNDLIAHVEPGPDVAATYKTLSVLIFLHVEQHCALYRALLGEEGPSVIAIRIRKHIARLMQRLVIEPLISDASLHFKAELLAAHAAGSLVALAAWWLDHDLSPSAEEMGYLFWRLVKPGIDDVLGRNAASSDEIVH